MLHLFEAKTIDYAAFINRYCLEQINWDLYEGIPQYDPELADIIIRSGHTRFLRIDFAHKKSEVFIPLSYYSAAGEHAYQFPGFAREEGEKPFVFSEEMMLEWIGEEHRLEDREMPELHFDPVFYPVKWMNNGLVENLETGTLLMMINSLAQKRQFALWDAALQWFSAYISLTLPFWLNDKYASQNSPLAFGLEVSESLPAVYQPDHENILAKSASSISEKQAYWVRHYLFGHILPLIGLLGKHTRVNELLLLGITRESLEKNRANDTSGLIDHLLKSRRFAQPGAIRFADQNYTCEIHNPLHQTSLVPSVLQPKNNSPVYEKTMQNGLHIRIRPVDIDRDLPMLHEWFHREHALPIWQMNWPMARLEHFYRCLLPGPFSHSFIGEINGVASFNLEVYWATRDVLGDYYDVQPGDYGTHLFIAPVKKEDKHPLATMQTIMEWLFKQPKIARLVGEGSVNSLPALMNKVQAGFRLQKIIEMPHKKAHLNFCIREWYYEKFYSAKEAAEPFKP